MIYANRIPAKDVLMPSTLQKDTVTLPKIAPPMTIQLLGLPVHNVTMEGALAQIHLFVHSGGVHHVVTADASMLVTAQEDRELAEIIRAASLVTPDSVGVLWGAKKRGTPLQERVSGVELVERLCALSPSQNYRIFFFGAAPGVAELASRKMCETYPGCLVVGTHDGFFTPEQIPGILEEIKATKPDILCVAFGIPKQEKWIRAYASEIGVPVSIGVGGTFDVLSGTVKRAPVLFQKLKLEWFWRVIKNPKKLNKVLLLPKFVKHILSTRG